MFAPPKCFSQELLREIDSLPWERLARRRVQHHGHRFDYAARPLFRCRCVALSCPSTPGRRNRSAPSRSRRFTTRGLAVTAIVHCCSPQAFRADEERPLGPFPGSIQAVVDRVHTLPHVEEASRTVALRRWTAGLAMKHARKGRELFRGYSLITTFACFRSCRSISSL